MLRLAKTLKCQKYVRSGGSFIRRTLHEELILHEFPYFVVLSFIL